MPSVRVSEQRQRRLRHLHRHRKIRQTRLSWPILTAAAGAAVALLVGVIVVVCVVIDRSAPLQSSPPAAPMAAKGSEPKHSDMTPPKSADTTPKAPVISPAWAPAAAAKTTALSANAKKPIAPPSVDPEPQTCGTAIEFASSPAEGARLAKTKGRLQFILHVSGYFDDPAFT